MGKDWGKEVVEEGRGEEMGSCPSSRNVVEMIPGSGEVTSR